MERTLQPDINSGYRAYNSDRRYFYIEHFETKIIYRFPHIGANISNEIEYHVNRPLVGKWEKISNNNIYVIAKELKSIVNAYSKKWNYENPYFNIFKKRYMYHSCFKNYNPKYKIAQIAYNCFRVYRLIKLLYFIPLFYKADTAKCHYSVFHGFEDGNEIVYCPFDFMSLEDCERYIDIAKRKPIKIKSFKTKFIK